MESIRIPRQGAGRPRKRPARALADEVYSSRANRRYLRRRGIKAVIPVKKDQQANRYKLGSKGGRPPAFDREELSRRGLDLGGVGPLRAAGLGEQGVQAIPVKQQPYARAASPGHVVSSAEDDVVTLPPGA
jgi:hypothetical protein